MGAGRSTRTYHLSKEKVEASWTVNSSVSARNLRKSDLGAVIFGCKHMTFQECIHKQLFGLPSGHFSYVKNVTPGLTLFLFNYTDRKLHGIFEAVSSGRFNIDSCAWTTKGEENTPYPAQVQVRVRKMCQPLSEDEFRPIMDDNYYTERLFWFELDHNQTGKLIDFFLCSPLSPPPKLAPPLANRANWNTMLTAAPNFESKQIGNVSIAAAEAIIVDASPEDMEQPIGGSYASRQVETSACHSQRMWSSLFKTAEWESCSTNHYDGDSLPSEALMDTDAKDVYNSEVKCAQDSIETQDTDQNLLAVSEWSGETEGNTAALPPTELQLSEVHTDHHFLAGGACSGEAQGNATGLPTSDLQLSDIQASLVKLMHDVGYLKGHQLRQSLKIYCLEQELAESRLETLQLRNQYNIMTSRPPSSSKWHSEKANFKPVSESDDCVLLVGGYDGCSWLSDFSSYSPSRNLVKHLPPMTSVRAYASAAKVCGELYLLGGEHDNVWYDTVDSYNPASNEWFRRPSLNQKKGSLAGVSIQETLFAIGGGNGLECFSEVEMLDMNIGKWIFLQPMQHKRFAPAVANVNGTVYVVGGYDGKDYLNSVERFDPREQKWTGTGSMSTKRGCHSVIALNEKIYALGGYDGAKMVPTVEVFDPRACSWMMGEPMKVGRGYFGAVLLGEKIYVIGGVRDDEILESIECYKEGYGWQLTSSSALGKRCFFSALTL